MLTLRPDSTVPLITQIIEGVRELIDRQTLRPGAKLPSIRAFAAGHSVSMFTVVEAYDRMVAQGILVSRAHQGFFVARRDDPSGQAPAAAAGAEDSASPPAVPAFDEAWYLQHVFENRALPVKPGCGWLPNDWLFEDGVRRSFRKVAAEGVSLDGYGDPMGYLPLRQHIAATMAQNQQLAVSPAQILLGHGSSQALDWAVRTLVRAGDVVLLDDPGYPNLTRILHFQGARLLGVPRKPGGYDLATLECLLAEYQPRVFFTQPRLQSPTGSRASPSQLHKLLTLASQYGLTVVENDLYADLDTENQPSLASLDQLQRVVHIGSYSKTISPNLRVGFMLASPRMSEQLAHLKMLSGLTSSEVSEKLVYHVLTDGRWRKHLKTLRERLKAAHQQVAAQLRALGFEIFSEPEAGLYLWARHPAIADSAQLARDVAAQGIVLGPGQLFRVDGASSGWIRFNVAFSQEPLIWDSLARLLPGDRSSSQGQPSGTVA